MGTVDGHSARPSVDFIDFAYGPHRETGLHVQLGRGYPDGWLRRTDGYADLAGLFSAGHLWPHFYADGSLHVVCQDGPTYWGIPDGVWRPPPKGGETYVPSGRRF